MISVIFVSNKDQISDRPKGREGAMWLLGLTVTCEEARAHPNEENLKCIV